MDHLVRSLVIAIENDLLERNWGILFVVMLSRIACEFWDRRRHKRVTIINYHFGLANANETLHSHGIFHMIYGNGLCLYANNR